MMDEEQRRYEKIRGAYRSVGRLANLYDGMMTYSTWSGKFVSRLVWGLDRAGVARYVGLALRAAHEGFAGRLLEVPVGTGCPSTTRPRCSQRRGRGRMRSVCVTSLSSRGMSDS